MYDTASATKATTVMNTIGKSTISDAANISAIVLVFILCLCFLCLFKGGFRPPLVIRLNVHPQLTFCKTVETVF